MHVCREVHVPQCMHTEVSSLLPCGSWGLSSVHHTWGQVPWSTGALHLVFLTQSLTESGAHLFSKTSWQQVPRILLSQSAQHQDYRCTPGLLAFLRGSWDKTQISMFTHRLFTNQSFSPSLRQLKKKIYFFNVYKCLCVCVYHVFKSCLPWNWNYRWFVSQRVVPGIKFRTSQAGSDKLKSMFIHLENPS